MMPHMSVLSFIQGIFLDAFQSSYSALSFLKIHDGQTRSNLTKLLAGKRLEGMWQSGSICLCVLVLPVCANLPFFA
jgi:hypothetical protein